MEYKVTAFTQSKGQFELIDITMRAPEICNSENVIEIQEMAHGAIIKKLKELSGTINTADLITVWRKNVYGLWSPITHY